MRPDLVVILDPFIGCLLHLCKRVEEICVKHWWRTDASGNCFLILRYGNKVLSPTSDKGAIAVGDKTKLPEILEAVIGGLRTGELDTAMAAAKAIDPARGVKKKAA